METSNSTNNNGSVLNLNERQTQLILRLKKHDGSVLSGHIEWLDIAISLLSQNVMNNLTEQSRDGSPISFDEKLTEIVETISSLEDLKDDLYFLKLDKDYDEA